MAQVSLNGTRCLVARSIVSLLLPLNFSSHLGLFGDRNLLANLSQLKIILLKRSILSILFQDRGDVTTVLHSFLERHRNRIQVCMNISRRLTLDVCLWLKIWIRNLFRFSVI
jgi:hypothetical protein